MKNNENNKDENSLNYSDINKMKSGKDKPVSTVVGRAFNAMELEELQKDLNKKDAEEKKSTLLGRSLSSIKQTIMGKPKKEDNDMKAALEAIKEGEAFLKTNTPKNDLIKPKSNVKVIKSLKDSKKELPTEEKKEEKRNLELNNLKKSAEKIEPPKSKTNTLKEEPKYNQKIEEATEEIEYLSEELDGKVTIVLNGAKLFVIRFLSSIMRLVLLILSPIVKLFVKPKQDEDIHESNDVVTENVEEALKASFNDISELNIILTDNYDTPLYKKSVNALSRLEEDIIIANAILAIQQCAEFTKDSPPMSEGLYKGQKIDLLMENVSKEDILIFLGYMKSKPKKYISKSWKISEIFATWLANNAPIGVSKGAS